MRFVADAMLGKLARWLRMMGYDTLCAADMPVDDDDLLTIAVDESRILLTRDRELFSRAKDMGISAEFIESTDIVEQLAQLVKDLGIELREEPSTAFCPSCNGRLVPVSKSEVVGLVPATVLDTHNRFWMCQSCGAVYWDGTHWKKIREVVEKVRERLK
jgi:uncharacterized protein with PIN domain